MLKNAKIATRTGMMKKLLLRCEYGKSPNPPKWTLTEAQKTVIENYKQAK